MNMITRTVVLLFGLAPVLATADDQVLEIEAIINLLLRQGYHDIREIELENRCYEVQALNTKGEKVTIYLDSDSGQLLEGRPVKKGGAAKPADSH